MVLIVTFGSTLLFHLEFAIYAGVFLSLALYLTRTSHPYIVALSPDPADSRRRFTDLDEKSLPECPQLKILRIDGSLFFGAVNHVAEFLEKTDECNPRHLLIVGIGIYFLDVSGALMLTQEAQRRKKLGKQLWLCRIKHDVHDFLERGEYLEIIGSDHLFSTESKAISEIFDKLDRNICRLCTVRIFQECREQNLPDSGA
jgi:SulP family sulfate permease